jgi:hypothetical protein
VRKAEFVALAATLREVTLELFEKAQRQQTSPPPRRASAIKIAEDPP